MTERSYIDTGNLPRSRGRLRSGYVIPGLPLAPVVPDLSILTDVLAVAFDGIAYTQTLLANGGDGVYSWSLIGGALPAGLSLSSDGVISGTTAAVGEYPITVEVEDGAGDTASRSFRLFVLDPAPVTIESHCALALSRLASQFREQPNYEALICGYADRWDVLEAAIAEVAYYAGIARAFGIRLDWIGELYPALREGRTDADYRVLLGAHAQRVTARGTIEDILRVVRAALTGTGVIPTLEDAYPAGLIVTTDGIVELMAQAIARLVRRTRPAGVGAVLWWTPPGVPLFGWISSVAPPTTPSVSGWASTTPPATDPAGRWARASA